jgi:hypothetical protein
VLLRALSPSLERRSDPTLPFGDSTPPPPGAFGGSVAGTNVSEQTALRSRPSTGR